MHRRPRGGRAVFPAGGGMNSDKQFLDRLSEADHAALMRQLRLERYDNGQIVLAQEEDSDDVFFVISGTARATIFSPDGKITDYRIVEPGAVFGELAAIDNGPRSASVIAVRDLEVGRMQRAHFAELVEKCPAFTWALLEHLAAQSRRMTERIFEYSTMLVRDRLVQELIRLGEMAVGDGERAEIQPAPTHFDLAARISTHREAISREMSKLTKQKLIAKCPGGVMRINVEGLRAIRRHGYA